MSAVESMLSAVYSRLAADGTLQAIVGSRIYGQTQKPQGAGNPLLCVFMRTTMESPVVGVLHDTYIDIVARDSSADGEGTSLTAIFDRVDALLNQTYLQTASASGVLSRAGLTVNPALYDEVQLDYFKRWTYRVIVKRK